MNNLAKIAGLDNQFEAQLLAAILEERRIPHLIKSFYDSAYDGLFQGQKGWGAVFAAENCRDEIIEILNGLRRAERQQE